MEHIYRASAEARKRVRMLASDTESDEEDVQGTEPDVPVAKVVPLRRSSSSAGHVQRARMELSQTLALARREQANFEADRNARQQRELDVAEAHRSLAEINRELALEEAMPELEDVSDDESEDDFYMLNERKYKPAGAAVHFRTAKDVARGLGKRRAPPTVRKARPTPLGTLLSSGPEGLLARKELLRPLVDPTIGPAAQHMYSDDPEVGDMEWLPESHKPKQSNWEFRHPEGLGEDDLGKRKHRYFGTYNNPRKMDYHAISSFIRNHCDWGIIGFEVGEQGTSHLQFSFTMPQGKTLSALKKTLPQFALCWLQPAKGSEIQCEEYCSKTGNYVTFGTRGPGQGARTEVQDADYAALIGSGAAGVTQFAVKFPKAFTTRHHGVIALSNILAKKRRLTHTDQVTWEHHMGMPGTGKSSASYAAALLHAQTLGLDENAIFSMTSSLLPWISNKYEGQKIIVLHDIRAFNGSNTKIPLATWLNMIDKNSCTMPVKGGEVEFQGQFFFTDSTFHPEKLYEEKAGEPASQLLRRCTSVIMHYGGVMQQDAPFSSFRIGNGLAPWEHIPLLNPPTGQQLQYSTAQASSSSTAPSGQAGPSSPMVVHGNQLQDNTPESDEEHDNTGNGFQEWLDNDY